MYNNLVCNRTTMIKSILVWGVPTPDTNFPNNKSRTKAEPQRCKLRATRVAQNRNQKVIINDSFTWMTNSPTSLLLSRGSCYKRRTRCNWLTLLPFFVHWVVQGNRMPEQCYPTFEVEVFKMWVLFVIIVCDYCI